MKLEGCLWGYTLGSIVCGAWWIAEASPGSAVRADVTLLCHHEIVFDKKITGHRDNGVRGRD